MNSQFIILSFYSQFHDTLQAPLQGVYAKLIDKKRNIDECKMWISKDANRVTLSYSKSISL